MAEHYASATWFVRAGEADTFVERWDEFLTWTREEHPGLDTASLLRSVKEPNRFVSLAQWRSGEARDLWKQSDGFIKRFGACRELCDDFIGDDYDRVTTI